MRTVVILEDISETRDWLAVLVQQSFPECEVSRYATLRSAVQGLDAGQDPDLALIDLGLPDGSGLDYLRRLRALGRVTTAVVTTAMSDDAMVVSALSAGADGYLLKDTPSEILMRQLKQISLGLPALSPAIARRIMTHFRNTGPLADDIPSLSERETEVLALIARGLRNSEVATEMKLAESTVAGYIKQIYRKLGISSRAEASWQATRLGLNRRDD